MRATEAMSRFLYMDLGCVYCPDAAKEVTSTVLPQLIPLLTPDSSIFIRALPEACAYIRVEADKVLGRPNLMNEIIWAGTPYVDDSQASENRYTRAHSTLLWYARDSKNYVFNYDEIDRIPYMAPGLVGKEKAQRGKTPTDVWFEGQKGIREEENEYHRIARIFRRIVKVHTMPGDLVTQWSVSERATNPFFGGAVEVLGRRLTRHSG